MAVPIVYTTKLEEMNIFKTSLTQMNVDSVINSIINESKPKYNLKRKIKRNLKPYPHLTCAFLSSYINAFNKKVARKGNVSDALLALCKPVRVVLEDIKYKYPTKSTTPPNTKRKKCLNENLEITSSLSSWRRKQEIIYDVQSQEYDIYSFDAACGVKQYANLHANNFNSKIYHIFKDKKQYVRMNSCCWYKRESFINGLLKFHKSMKFMKKQHKCSPTGCRCCCKPKLSVSDTTPSKTAPIIKDKNTQTPLEAPGTWLKRITKTTFKNTVPTSLRVVPEIPQTNDTPEKELPFLHSTTIRFGDEFYEIGMDGRIIIYLKKHRKDSQSNSTRLLAKNVIDGDICCWYRRENFAERLLQLRALPTTVNFLRTSHICSVTNCNCCCKPINGNKTSNVFLSALRHTNDLTSKKVYRKIKLLNVKKSRNVSDTNDQNVISFSVSLPAINNISNTTNKSLNHNIRNALLPETTTDLVKNNLVRFIIDKSGSEYAIGLEGVELSSMSIRELNILDIIFCAIEDSLPENRRPLIKTKTKTNNNKIIPRYIPTKQRIVMPKVPNALAIHTTEDLLNEKVSFVTDLRYKRFLPSLKEHLKKYNLHTLKDLSDWF